MGALLGKMDDFDAVARLCGGCALASILFLMGLIVAVLVYYIRRDSAPPSDP